MRIWAGFRRLTRDEKKSRIKNRRQARRPVRVTSAHSAGSCGSFRGVPKWGQNRRGDMASAVVFPESLLLQEKSGGHAPEKMLL